MIRLACPSDKDAVISLWNRCFPDDSGFNAYFFSKEYDEGQTVLLFDHDMLCAMTQMLPYQLRIEERLIPATYIYGACTAPEMRRRGYMAELLYWTFALDKQSGREASILIPQEPWLFDFYAKYGYELAFFLGEDIDLQLLPEPCAYAQKCTYADIAQMEQLYQATTVEYTGVVVRTLKQWSAQIQMFQAVGAGVFGLFQRNRLSAYAFVWEMPDKSIWIQELCADSKATQEMLCADLCAKYEVCKIRLSTLGRSRPFGCAKFYNGIHLHNGYMNLMFN